MMISTRAKAIEQYIGTHPESQIGKWPLEISGEKKILPFYRLPLDLLCFNVNNGRLAMDVAEWETQNGRKLDTTDCSDEDVIRSILLI